jgi:hypothetical protein
MRTWEWTDVRTTAAEQVADGRLTDAEIAGLAGIRRETLCRRWKRRPEFLARVLEIQRENAARLREEQFTTKAGRIKLLIADWEATERIVQARRGHKLLAEAPGGDTGLVVRRIKILPNPNPEKPPMVVSEDLADVALLRERRGILAQIADEVGMAEIEQRLQLLEEAANLRPRRWPASA